MVIYRRTATSIARSEQGPLRHLNNCPRGEATAMLHKGNDEYLTLQSNIICLLLFFVSVLLITQHPAWFG